MTSEWQRPPNMPTHAAQKMKFSVTDFSSKYDQIRRKLRIWSHLRKKSVMETAFFVQRVLACLEVFVIQSSFCHNPIIPFRIIPLEFRFLCSDVDKCKSWNKKSMCNIFTMTAITLITIYVGMILAAAVALMAAEVSAIVVEEIQSLRPITNKTNALYNNNDNKKTATTITTIIILSLQMQIISMFVMIYWG